MTILPWKVTCTLLDDLVAALAVTLVAAIPLGLAVFDPVAFFDPSPSIAIASQYIHHRDEDGDVIIIIIIMIHHSCIIRNVEGIHMIS